MLRAPFSLEKTTYDAARGAVIYRSKLSDVDYRMDVSLPFLYRALR